MKVNVTLEFTDYKKRKYTVKADMIDLNITITQLLKQGCTKITIDTKETTC